MKKVIDSELKNINLDECPTQRKLIPVPLWNKYQPFPSVAGLRWLIFNEHTNGFHKCIRRVGKRVLIDEVKFFEWVDEQNGVIADEKGGASC